MSLLSETQSTGSKTATAGSHCYGVSPTWLPSVLCLQRSQQRQHGTHLGGVLLLDFPDCDAVLYSDHHERTAVMANSSECRSRSRGRSGVTRFMNQMSCQISREGRGLSLEPDALAHPPDPDELLQHRLLVRFSVQHLRFGSNTSARSRASCVLSAIVSQHAFQSQKAST